MRFTLERGTWYACEIIGDEFGEDKCSYSPIKVLDVVPGKTGKRFFALGFRHLNYPEGVQRKEYELQTIERGETFILARSMTHTPPRFLLIYAIDTDWLRRHFSVSIEADANIAEYLDGQ